MIYTLAFTGAVLVLLYWMYKKFRGPAYTPGMVAELAKSKPEAFEPLEEQPIPSGGEHSKHFWKFPDDMQIFYFSPKLPNTTNPILALHGGPSIPPHETWPIAKEQLPQLIVYHARGCGFSSRPFSTFPTPGKMWPGMQQLEATLGMGQQIADIERIRRICRIDRLDLVGHSFGGCIATLYATEFPDRVRSLTLLVPAAVLTLPASSNNNTDLFGLVRRELQRQGNQQHVDEYEAFLKHYLDFSNLPNETEEGLAQRQAGFAQHYFRAIGKGDSSSPLAEPSFTTMVGGMACYATLLSMGMEHDYVPACRQRLLAATFPVSIVHGDQDLIPVATSLQYQALFPAACNANVQVLSDANHESLLEDSRVAKIIQDTIASATT